MRTILLLTCCLLSSFCYPQKTVESSNKSWAFELSYSLRTKPELINKTGGLHPNVKTSKSFAFGVIHQRNLSEHLSLLVGLNGSAHLDFWLSDDNLQIQSVATNVTDLTALRLNIPIGLSMSVLQSNVFNLQLKAGFINAVKVMDYGFSVTTIASFQNDEEYRLSLDSGGIDHQIDSSPFLGLQLDFTERLYFSFDVIYNTNYTIKGQYKLEHYTNNQLDDGGFAELNTQKTRVQFGLGYKFIK